MNVTNGMLLKQAQSAIRAGHLHRGRQLLQQLLHADPHNVTAWLWLARIAPSLQQAERYVTRAEMLQPAHPAVKKARTWINEQQQTARDGTPTVKKRRQRQKFKFDWQTAVLRSGLVLVMLALLAFSGWLLWQHAGGSTDTETALQPVQIATRADDNTDNRGSALPSGTATATPMPQFAAKQIAENNQLRPTWTITPTPSPTPSPTPTMQPTFVSSSYTDGARPFGVGPTERWINVNLTTQMLTAYEGDTAVFSTYISSGVQDHPTVTGQFRVWLRYESQTMDGRLLGYDYYLENVPYVMYFFEDYALHGAYWHNNFGTPMSHGCVNIHPDDAAWLYNWASLGTLVNVHY